MSDGPERIIIEFIKVMRDVREIAKRIETIQEGILETTAKNEKDSDRLVRLAEIRNDDFRRFLDDLKTLTVTSNLRHDRNERILSEILNASKDYFRFGRSREDKDDEP